MEKRKSDELLRTILCDVVTSFVLLGREQGIDKVAQREAAVAVVQSYIARLRQYALASPLDAWYSIIDSEALIREADLQGAVLANDAAMCGWSLARAHAKSGHATRLSGYVGSSGKLAESLAQFACSYADQCERDFEAFMQAIRSGLLPAEVESAH